MVPSRIRVRLIPWVGSLRSRHSVVFLCSLTWCWLVKYWSPIILHWQQQTYPSGPNGKGKPGKSCSQFSGPPPPNHSKHWQAIDDAVMLAHPVLIFRTVPRCPLRIGGVQQHAAHICSERFGQYQLPDYKQTGRERARSASTKFRVNLQLSEKREALRY